MEFKSEKILDICIVHVYITRATLTKAVDFKDFLNVLIDEGSKKFVIDLSACEYIDSTFLGAIVSVLKKLNASGGDLRLVYNKDVPSLIFMLTRMDKVFKIFDDLSLAITSYNPAEE
jgi:anti-anti-sigma factor